MPTKEKNKEDNFNWLYTQGRLNVKQLLILFIFLWLLFIAEAWLDPYQALHGYPYLSELFVNSPINMLIQGMVSSALFTGLTLSLLVIPSLMQMYLRIAKEVALLIYGLYFLTPVILIFLETFTSLVQMPIDFFLYYIIASIIVFVFIGWRKKKKLPIIFRKKS